MTGCDWYALPPIIGTNMYSLDGAGAQSPDISDLAGAGWPDADGNGSFGLNFYVCPGTLPDWVYDEMDSDGVLAAGGVDVRISGDEERCGSGGSGDMAMTIFLRFDTPNSAAGVLSFNGNMNGDPFAAQAPPTVTR